MVGTFSVCHPHSRNRNSKDSSRLGSEGGGGYNEETDGGKGEGG